MLFKLNAFKHNETMFNRVIFKDKFTSGVWNCVCFFCSFLYSHSIWWYINSVKFWLKQYSWSFDLKKGHISKFRKCFRLKSQFDCVFEWTLYNCLRLNEMSIFFVLILQCSDVDMCTYSLQVINWILLTSLIRFLHSLFTDNWIYLLFPPIHYAFIIPAIFGFCLFTGVYLFSVYHTGRLITFIWKYFYELRNYVQSIEFSKLTTINWMNNVYLQLCRG